MRRLTRRRFLGEAAVVVGGTVLLSKAEVKALGEPHPPRTFAAHAGDWCTDSRGHVFLCEASGTPGKWRRLD